MRLAGKVAVVTGAASGFGEGIATKFVTEGAKVSVRVPAYPGQTFAGKVKHIGEVVDPNTRTVKIRSVVDNPATPASSPTMTTAHRNSTSRRLMG